MMRSSSIFRPSLLAVSVSTILLSGCLSSDSDNETSGEATPAVTGLTLEYVGRYSSTVFGESAAEITGYDGYELKRVMRTGTVASIDNRNWELWDQRGLVQRFSQSRAIALDMESATIAANGFRFRVPYGTLLCVSDKPLHGELKLPGMATDFYKRQGAQHLEIGIRAREKLRDMSSEKLHSRKLRSFAETAFQ